MDQDDKNDRSAEAQEFMQQASPGVPLPQYVHSLAARFPKMSLHEAIEADMSAGSEGIKALLRGQNITYLPPRALPGRKRNKRK